MAIPGFAPDQLDSAGCPIWLSELADGEPNHTLHVVRDLEPAEALGILGAKRRLIQPCELPAAKPDSWTSLPGAALGIEPGSSAVLLAGSIRGWTFIYDDSGFTSHEDTTFLSAAGRTAATSMYSHYAGASLSYCVDDTQLVWTDIDSLDLGTDLPCMPAELGTAFRAAGTVDRDALQPGRSDREIFMRTACALAGLSCSLDDIRGIPLLAAPFG